MDNEKFVDESWKDTVANDKCGCSDKDCGCSSDSCDDGSCSCEGGCGEGDVEVNFFNYLTSLGYQAMIFLGVIPNPMTGQTEQNLRQAKFIIDTLVLLKEKTKGNLNEQENAFLEGTVYELQMRFVEVSQKGGTIIS